MPLGTSLPDRPTRPDESNPIFVSETGGDDSRTKEQAQTEGTPWKTVSKFLANAEAGDVCYVKDFPDQVADGVDSVGYRPTTANQHIVSGKAGTEADPILLKAYPGHRPIILPATVSPTIALRITSTSPWWVVDGFEFPYGAGAANDPVVYIGAAGANDNIEIFDCWIHGATVGSGLLSADNNSNLHIYNNKVWANDDAEAAQSHGIYIQASGSVIANNICRDHANGFGIQLRTDETAVPLVGVIVANNTCVRNKTNGSGMVLESDAEDCQAWNNILVDNGNYGIRGFDVSVVGTGNIARKNVAFGNDVGTYANRNSADIWDWSGAGGFDSPPGDNLTDDPLFENEAGSDFRLTADSPAIGYGNEAYCPTFDHNGDARTQCDAGAFRYATPTQRHFEWRF